MMMVVVMMMIAMTEMIVMIKVELD